MVPYSYILLPMWDDLYVYTCVDTAFFFSPFRSFSWPSSQIKFQSSCMPLLCIRGNVSSNAHNQRPWVVLFFFIFSLSLSPLNIYSHTEKYTYTYEYIETRATRCNYAEPWEGFTVLLPSLTSPPYCISLSLCSLVRFRQLFYSQVHP